MINTLGSLSVAMAGPAPAGDIVAIVYKDSSGSALYVEPLPPQSLTCLGPVQVGAVGCPVDRVWYGFANISSKPTPSGFTAVPISTGTGSLSWDTWRR